MVKSQGRRTQDRVISMMPRAPDSKRTRAEEASSISTGRVVPGFAGLARSRTKVSDCALTSAISPTIQCAMSMRCAPRSAIDVPPIFRSKRQSKGIAGSTNSSESQIARHSWTLPTLPSAIMRFISETAGSLR